jgi:hypothetical protein
VEHFLFTRAVGWSWKPVRGFCSRDLTLWLLVSGKDENQLDPTPNQLREVKSFLGLRYWKREVPPVDRYFVPELPHREMLVRDGGDLTHLSITGS